MKKLLYFLVISIILLSNCSSQISKNDAEKAAIKNEKSESDEINEIKRLIKENKLREAKEIAETKIRKDPDNIPVMLLLAEILYIQKDYLSSLEILKNIVDKVEDKPKVLLSIGHNYYYLREYYNALSTYKKVVEIDPMLLDAYIKIGDIYSEWGNFKKASEWYNKAIEIDKRSAEIYVSMAKMNFEMKLIKKAQNLLKEALYINPMSFEGRKLEIIILYETKNYKELEEKAKSFINDFNNPDGFLFIGKFYLENNKVKESYQYFINALEKGKEYAPSYNGMGNYYYETNDFNKSEYFYNKALELNPKYAEVYYNLGLLKIKTSEYDTAIKYFKKAYSLNKSLNTSLAIIGLAYYKKGEEKKAIESVIDFYITDALLYSNTLRSEKYGPFIGNIVANYWKYYDRNDNYHKALYLLLVESPSGAISLLEKTKNNPISYFLLSRLYFINNQEEKGKDAFLKYVNLEKPNRELILLDSSFNSVKEKEWFINSLGPKN